MSVPFPQGACAPPLPCPPTLLSQDLGMGAGQLRLQLLDGLLILLPLGQILPGPAQLLDQLGDGVLRSGQLAGPAPQLLLQAQLLGAPPPGCLFPLVGLGKAGAAAQRTGVGGQPAHPVATPLTCPGGHTWPASSSACLWLSSAPALPSTA